MTTSRDNNQLDPTSLLRHTFISGVATFASYPLRVLLYRAGFNQDPVSTIKDALPRMTHGATNNLIRGTLAASSQSYSKNAAQEHAGFLAGITASAVSGTLVATLTETRLIRKISLALLPENTATLWRFNVPLSALYFMREVGFVLSVLGKNDLPPSAQTAALIAAAGVTASIQKLAAVEATRDLLPNGITAPNLRDGMIKTIRAMSNGNVYTHPAFQVRVKSPKSIMMQSRNFFSVACGWNMFAFRLLYLYGFREAYHYAAETPTSVGGWSALFRKALSIKGAAKPDIGTPRDGISHKKN